MTPKSAARKLGQLSNAIDKAGRKALASAQTAAYNEALKDSSGATSQKQLDEMGNPYGHGDGLGVRSGIKSRKQYKAKVRGAIPHGNPGIINAQSGDFKRAWQKGTLFTDGAGDLHAPVVNLSPEAAYLDGQPHGKMIARPIAQKIVDSVSKTIMDRIQAAIRRTLK